MELGVDTLKAETSWNGPNQIKAAIVDYGLGNLFSIRQACEYANMCGDITSDRREILDADLVILPGVGAFGDAMNSLRKLDLVTLLQDVAASGTPLVGICLGMQLLLTESHEFGRHAGLGIIPGEVVRFENSAKSDIALKVPHIGWNRIMRRPASTLSDWKPQAQDPWQDSPLQGLPDAEYMYFVHSFYSTPVDPDVVLACSRYGGIEFCSSLQYHNIFACQFHPERSGSQGLRIYQNIASLVRQRREEING